MPRFKRLAAAVICITSALTAASDALAIAGRDEVASRGEPATALPDWPEGVLAMINDPLRTEGWHSWLSELPNDHFYYGMDVRTPEGVNRLIRLLAAIRADEVRVVLDPAGRAPYRDHLVGVGAVFSLGTQSTLDDWFRRLPQVEPGVRRFGAHEYREPPKAQPPTLTLYVGHPAVDLEKLVVPPNVRVSAPTGAAYRAEHEEAFRAIDALIEKHRAGQKD